MVGGICIIFFLGTIPYSLSAPDPLDAVNININLGEGTKKGYGSVYFGGFGYGGSYGGGYGYGGLYGNEGYGGHGGGPSWSPHTQRGQQRDLQERIQQEQSRQDYCKMDKEHTMCKYSGPSPACKQKTLDRGISSDDRVFIVDMHNELRRKVAKGLETEGRPGPQHAASDMLMMVWDNELATIAQRWADQCIYGHDAVASTNEGPTGQNVGITWRKVPAMSDFLDDHYDMLIQEWYDEVNIVNRDVVTSWWSFKPRNHYTQLAWGSSRKLGCGSVHFDDGPGKGDRRYKVIFVCNYYKQGNKGGHVMYSPGRQCSACPADYPKCSDALCT